MKKIEIEINERGHVNDLIVANEFERVDVESIDREQYPFVDVYDDIYVKDNKYYVLLRHDEYNGFIYTAELLEVESLSDAAEYFSNNTLEKIKKALCEEVLTLDELDTECHRLFEDDTDCISDFGKESIIEEYEANEDMTGHKGAFAWSGYNVWFTILKDTEELADIVVRVDEIEVI